jgi:hypothetical protein
MSPRRLHIACASVSALIFLLGMLAAGVKPAHAFEVSFDRGLLEPDWAWVKNPSRQSSATNRDTIAQLDLDKDLAELLPRTFMIEIPIHDGRQSLSGRVQRFLDTALLDLLKSPTAQTLAYRISGGLGFLMEFKLGLSYRLHEIVRSVLQPWRDRNYESQLWQTPPGLLPPGKFTIVYTPSDAQLHSWTNHIDATYIFIQPKDLRKDCKNCDENFLRVLAHEWAHTGDAKAEFPAFGVFESRFIAPSVSHAHAGQSSTCMAYSAITHPRIRLALSTLRALTVEDRVARELGFKPRSSRPASFTCQDWLIEGLRLTRPYAKLLQDESAARLAQIDNSCHKKFSDYPIKSLIETIVESSYRSSDGRVISLCDHLLEPEFTSPLFKTSFSRGPRPRIGDGVGDGGPPKLSDAERETLLKQIDAEARRQFDQLKTPGRQ